MASINPHGYNVTVRQVVIEGETLFEARVKELPDACDYAESASDAYDLAIDTIETSAEIFARDGRAFPPPARPQDDFSGRVTLRLPKRLHRQLAGTAESEGVSLNQHLLNVLSYDAGSRTGVRIVTIPAGAAGAGSTAQRALKAVKSRSQAIKRMSADWGMPRSPSQQAVA